MLDSVWLRFRILSVVLLGVGYFFFDIIEGAMFELKVDELISLALAGYALWALVWQKSESSLRPKGMVVAGLYVLLTVADMFWFASGSSGDEFLSFLITFVAVPLLLIVGSAATALLLFIRWRERTLRQRAKKLLRLVSERTSELEKRGVELHRMNNELTRLSYFDPLTNLANRRRLLEQLQAAWNDAHSKGESLAFILLDVDDFKAINDHYGHLVGDDYLRKIAQIIERTFDNREMTAGRYGGEEFGFVMPNSEIESAATLAEKIRCTIENEKITHVGSSRGIVTVSLGVAAMRPHAGANPELIIAAADAALYLAKQNGKNRIELAGK